MTPMRCVNVKLPKPYIDILEMYGSLDSVTDKALNMVYTDQLPPINEMPAVPVLSDICKRVIKVTNEEYDDNCKLLGPKHHSNSIKRLLTYIVDNEIYLNWQMRETASDTYSKRLLECIGRLDKLSQIAPLQDRKKINEALTILETL